MGKVKNRKVDNTYVFRSFSEILADIKLSSIRKDGRHSDVQEDDAGSYFGEALFKWRELNLSKHFDDFYLEIQGKTSNLLIVIHNQNHLVESLDKHLRVPNSLAYEALLDLMIQLSKDLQEDFYTRHFGHLHSTLSHLLRHHHHNPDLLKHIFSAYCFLFKILQKQFIDNIQGSFDLFSVLLDDHVYKHYVNKFAAQAFSFLMRKHKDQRLVLTMALFKAFEEPALCQGVALLLFEMVRGVKYQFYSQAPLILKMLLDLLEDPSLHQPLPSHLPSKQPFLQSHSSIPPSTHHTKLPPTHHTIFSLWNHLCGHTNQSHSQPILSIPLEKLNGLLTSPSSSSSTGLARLMLMVVMATIKHKSARLYESFEDVAKLLKQMLSGGVEGGVVLQREVLTLAAEVLLHERQALLSAHTRRSLLAAAFSSQCDTNAIFAFTRLLCKLPLFEAEVLPEWTRHSSQLLQQQQLVDVFHSASLLVACRSTQASFVCNFRLPEELIDFSLKKLRIMNSFFADGDDGDCVEKSKDAAKKKIEGGERGGEGVGGGGEEVGGVEGEGEGEGGEGREEEEGGKGEKGALWSSDGVREIWQVLMLLNYDQHHKEERIAEVSKFLSHLHRFLINNKQHPLKRLLMCLLKQSLVTLANLTNNKNNKNLFVRSKNKKNNNSNNNNNNNNNITNGHGDGSNETNEEDENAGEDEKEEEEKEGDEEKEEDDEEKEEKKEDEVALEQSDNKLISLPMLYKLLQDFSEEECVLYAVNYCMEVDRSLMTMCQPHFPSYLNLLQHNLTNCKSQVRLLSLKILNHFEPVLPENADENCLRVCLDIEQTPLSLADFRSKLCLLQKLTFDHVRKKIPIGCEHDLPLRFLLGQLYCNFQVLFKPTASLIASYAHQLPSNAFWKVFAPVVIKAGEYAARSQSSEEENDDEKEIGMELDDAGEQTNEQTNEQTKKEASEQTNTETQNDTKKDTRMETKEVVMETEEVVMETSVQTMALLFEKHCSYFEQKEKLDRVDHLLFRESLWTCMRQFPSECQAKSRVIVPVFLSFLQDEYHYSWDDPRYQSHQTHLPNKNAHRALVNHLSLFATFTDPRNTFNQQQLHQLYMELLKMSSPDLQKVALACLSTYRHPYLEPHKESLGRLLDERTFAEEMLNFTGDDLPQTHRVSLVPVIMRIMLGKMRMRKKGGEGNRRMGKITNYLASFQPSESAYLLQLLFAPFEHIVQHDVLINAQEILRGERQVLVPVKKQIGILLTLDTMTKRMGGLLRSHLDAIFNITTSLVAYCNAKSLVHHTDNSSATADQTTRTSKSFKAVRSLAVALLNEFFGRFADHAFTTSQLQALFTAVVSPMMHRLPSECSKTPSHLFKLLLTWSKQHRFHCLFAKYLDPPPSLSSLAPPSSSSAPPSSSSAPPSSSSAAPSSSSAPPSSSSAAPSSSSAAPSLEPSSTPTSILLTVLQNTPHTTISTLVLDIIHNLLTITEADDDDDDDEHGLDDNDGGKDEDDSDGAMPFYFKEKNHKPPQLILQATLSLEPQTEVPVGKQTVLHYLNSLVTYLGDKIGSKNMHSLNRELLILSCVGAHITQEQMSCKLVGQLMGMLAKGGRNSQVLVAVTNLLANVQDCLPIVRPLASLFGSMKDNTSRKHLCALLEVLASKLPSVNEACVIVGKLNAMIEGRMDEVDFEKRMDAFIQSEDRIKIILNAINTHQSQATDFINNSQSAYLCDELLLYVYNFTFFLSNSDDKATRDNSMLGLKAILKWRATCGEGGAGVVDSRVIKAISSTTVKNLKHPVETHRNCFIRLFTLIMDNLQGNHAYRSLAQLQVLRGEGDEEKDFLLNIIHFQISRKSKALRKLATVLQEDTTISSTTLATYILPIVISTLNHPSTSSTDLTDSSLVALSSLAARLPWSSYIFHLRRQLSAVQKFIGFHAYSHNTGGEEGKEDDRKLVVREIICLLGAFPFDLSLSHLRKQAASKGDSELREKEVPKEQGKEALPEAAKEGEEEAMQVQEEEEEEEDGVPDETFIANATSVSSTTTGKPSNTPTSTNAGPYNTSSLSASQATVVHKVMLNEVMPVIIKCLTHKTRSEDDKDSARSDDDNEVLRIPMALAATKLLLKMPPGSLEKNVHGLVVKLCYFLNSRSIEVRNVSRDTLKKMLVCLGAGHLKYIFSELKSHLARGYQLHVLSFTAWSLLNELHATNLTNLQNHVPPVMHVGALDDSVSILLEIFERDLVGGGCEEKDIEKIKRALWEARSVKAFDAFRLMAAYSSPASLPCMVVRLKELLQQTHKHKVLQRLQEVMARMVRGVLENKHLPLHFLFQFVYSLLTALHQSNSQQQPTKQAEGPQAAYSLLLPSDPSKKNHNTPKTSSSNEHFIHEFALKLLYRLLKRPDVTRESVDAFVQVLCAGVDSKHVKVSLESLKCLSVLTRMQLPSFHTLLSQVVNKSFVNVSTKATTGHHAQVVEWSFKVLQSILIHLPSQDISHDHLNVLLCHAERHLYENDNTAFPIILAILRRKFASTELMQLVQKVREMSITSHDEVLKAKCRKVVMTYLLDYPLDDKTMTSYVNFYARQLEYENEGGRTCALSMLTHIINVFPQSQLDKHSSTLFLQLSLCRLNETSIALSQATNDALLLLSNKVSTKERDKMIGLTLEWMSNHKLEVRTMASMVMKQMESAHKQHHHQHRIFTTLSTNLHADRITDTSIAEQRQQDRYFFHSLDLLLTMANQNAAFEDPSLDDLVCRLLTHVQALMKYSHDSVRSKSCQIFNHLLQRLNDSYQGGVGEGGGVGGGGDGGGGDGESGVEDADASRQRGDDVTVAKGDSVVSLDVAVARGSLQKRSSDLSRGGLKKRKLDKEEEEEEADEGLFGFKPKLKYFKEDFVQKIHELVGILCFQLSSPVISAALATEVTRCLRQTALIVHRIEGKQKLLVKKKKKNKKMLANDDGDDEDEDEDEEFNDADNDVDKKEGVSVGWLIKRVAKETWMELVNNPKCTVKRRAIFVWQGALVSVLGGACLSKHLPYFLRPLIRQQLDNSPTDEGGLKELVVGVLEEVQKEVGVMLYSKCMAQIHRQLSNKKNAQKVSKKQQATTNPEAYVKRKMKKSLNKKKKFRKTF